MISTSINRVKISEVIQSQIPEYIDFENPRFSDFLRQYYISQEFQGGVVDIAESLSEYKNLDFLNKSNLVGYTTLTNEISFFDDTISVSSTKGWPQSYGLFKIDDEIITYTGISSNTFTGCIRGFSGIENLHSTNTPEYLTFSSTGITTHVIGAKVNNLSNLFLTEFLTKIKTQILPGFEKRNLYSTLNESNFIRQAKDFYKSKGTEEAFKILFKALYNEDVSLIKPQEYLMRPSDAEYIKNQVLVCELIEGNPLKIEGQTLVQETLPMQTSGAIYKVEPFLANKQKYYKIDISDGTIFGKFISYNRSIINSNVSSGSSIINVDSTVGFATSGSLFVNEIFINYSNKNYNQFFGVTGVTTSISIGSTVNSGIEAISYENGDINNPVRFRILSILSNLNQNANYQNVNDYIDVKTLGKSQEDIKFTSWIYNASTKSTILSITSVGSNNYRIKFYNDHQIYNEDDVNLISLDTSDIISAKVNSIINSKEIQINPASFDINQKYFVRRLLKTNLNGIIANIQNTYADNSSLYVTSNSLPHWKIDAKKRIRTFTNSGIVTDTQQVAIIDHYYQSGDLVTYFHASTNKALSGLSTGQSYYIKKITSNSIYLALSLENARIGEYITIYNNSDLESTGITTHYLIPQNVAFSDLDGQKLIRIFDKPAYDEESVEISNGGIGLLANGVELYTYKSSNKVYYGPIESISVLNEGSDYDVINSPRLSVSQSGHTGAGSSIIPHLQGELKEIIVDSSGLDYLEEPKVIISGGNSKGYLAKAKMKLVSHDIEFNSSSIGGVVNTSTDIFNFPEAHGIKNAEEIIYLTNGTTSIGIGTTPGTLINEASYYCIKKDDYSFSLTKNLSDALSGINTINITTNGQGYHKFETKIKRLKVDKVEISQIGSNFYNRHNTAPSNNINIYTDTITINNHGFSSGEIINYSSEGSLVGGLSTTTNYYIIKVDDNQFRLSKTENLNSHVNLTSIGSSFHIFAYPPITVIIDGRQGISTSNAIATPIVRGKITNIHIKDGGSDFGSILMNDNFKPNIDIIKGSGAVLKPYIVNGKIESIIVKNGGENYFDVPVIEIVGNGYGAYAKAVIQNGKIISVNVIQKGIGYNQNNTQITAIVPGKDAKFSANLKVWTVNEVFVRNNIKDIGSDDGFYATRRNDDLGNPYVNYYVPRKLRTFLKDTGTTHSPILGWAYDGSPIYGPYAYANSNGSGNLKYLNSSYTVISGSRISGPNLSTYPAGFFVEDYRYSNGTGDLDEHNGRFAVTPEYPNGVYAYYATVSSRIVNNSGSPFNNSRIPIFPYVIGNKFNFKPNLFNFQYDSTQDKDISSYKVTRNTKPHKLEEGYEFVKTPYIDSISEAKVKSILDGSIESIQIENPGQFYNVNDKLVFNNTGTDGFGAIGKVSEIVGSAITNITSIITGITSITLVSDSNRVTGICTIPHNLKNNSYVKISGISSELYANLTGNIQINVKTVKSGLSTEMLSTGLTTSITISDSVSKFNVNDIIKIDNEKMLIMGVDLYNNKLNLLRSYDNTSGSAHTNGAEIIRLEKEFSYYIPKELNINSQKNEVIFFDASTSVGVGLSYGVGIGTTISYIGAGNSIVYKFIPTRTIYLPDHSFKNGERVIYSPGAGTSLTVSADGINQFVIPKNVYMQKIDKDLVGIVSSHVGINSDLQRLYFNGNVGIGNSHSFTTNRTIITANLQTVDVIVSTATSHRLVPSDTVTLSVVSSATSSIAASYSSGTRFISIGSSNNPPINVTRGDYLTIDTSNATLLNTKLDFYLDQNFNKKFVGSGVSSLEIRNYFSPGVTSSRTIIHCTEQIPQILYYKFNSTNLSKIIETNKNIKDYNKIVINSSKFNGTYSITTTTDQTFTFNIFDIPERVGYTSNSYLKYTTNSNQCTGPISKIILQDGGKKYKKLPQISIASTTGKSCVLRPYGKRIGKIGSIDIFNYGYDYPSDKTLVPQAKIPNIIKLKDNFSVNRIGITSTGSNYLSPPNLVIYNDVTNLVSSEVELKALLQGGSISSVQIINSGGSLKSTDNRVVSVNNTNGVGIISAIYSSPNVTLRLQTPASGFSTDIPLPFQIGDQIFVENVGVTSGKGFNSSEYGYRYWTISGVNTAFGLLNQATISYEIDENPGYHDGLQYGTVSNSKNLPSFTLSLKEAEFLSGEEVFTKTGISKVVKSDDKFTSILRVEDVIGINTGDQIKGKSSGSSGIIESIEYFEGYFDTSSTISVSKGWEKDTGKPNFYYQRIADNDYYQNFSYSLKSRVGISSWDEPVDSLSHIAGFKKHSNLLIPSDSLAGLGSTSVRIGITTSANRTIIIDAKKELYCKHDFDLVYEKTNSNATISDEIIFKSKRFGDSLLCLTNRVLEIDDISPQFYSDPFISRTLEMDTLDITQVSAVKYYAQIVLDVSLGLTFNDAQYVEFLVTHDGTISYNLNYSDLFEIYKLGTFGTSLTGNTLSIIFSPYNTAYTYDITFYKEIVNKGIGIGSVSYGSITKVGKGTYIPSSGSPIPTTTSIIDANQYKSGTILLSAYTSDLKEVKEFSFIGIGSTVSYTSYANMNSNSGIGTFDIFMNGSNQILLNYTPVAGYAVTVSTLSTLVGVDTHTNNNLLSRIVVGDTEISSTRTEILSSGSPTNEIISTINYTNFSSIKYLVEIQNITDNTYCFFNISASVYQSDVIYNKYANLSTASNSNRNIQNIDIIASGNDALLRFLPELNKSYTVRVSEYKIQKPDAISLNTVIPLP
jgi:hypothetical protein